MINLRLFFLLFLFVNHCFAQDFKKVFFGEDYELYKGAHLMINPDFTGGLNHTFYRDLKDIEEEYNTNVLYPSRRYSSTTAKDSLINKVYLVEKIINNYGEPYKSKSLVYKPFFVLRDTKSNEIIFYKYDKKYDNNFPFLVSGVVLSENNLCEKIEKKTDDFKDVITFNSPSLSYLEYAPVVVYKFKDKQKTTIAIRLVANSSSLEMGGKTSIVLFSDGSKWTKDSKIDIQTSTEGYYYIAEIELNEEDIRLFSTKSISKFRVHLFDRSLDAFESEKAQIYIKCIKNI